jgi:glycosyltransferase involved in cell wall biosynthesis
MADDFDVSVVISTYNRCDLLPRTLESILHQDAAGVRYEVIVVDNNSTDGTRAVLESYLARGHANFRHLFEGRQGVSYGRNTGIAAAGAPIIAFTDDDLIVSPDWVAEVKRALDRHTEVDYVGGKVLPHPGQEFPPWLTEKHWYPVTLRDPGAAPFYLNSGNPICMGSGDLAVRRDILRQFDSFSPEFPRGQDRELQLRLWRAGRQGMYIPALVVFAGVQPERLTKAYHRAWYATDGRLSAEIRDEEVERSSARFFDVPAHMYRQAALDGWHLFRLRLLGRADESFFPELQLRYFWAFFRKRREDFSRTRRHGVLSDFFSFIRALVARRAAIPPR